jgi:GTPase SAR1 family protein
MSNGMQLWDIGSQVKSLDMAVNYLHNCDAALVVYDVMQREVSAHNTPGRNLHVSHHIMVRLCSSAP